MAKKTEGRSQGCDRVRRGTGGDGYPFEMLRVNTDENALKWIFHRTPDAQWRWRKTSQAQGVIAESTACYPNYGACVADAEAHGYKKWLVPAQLTPLSFPYGMRDPIAAHTSTAAVSSSPGTNPLKVIPLRGNGAR